MRQAPWNLARRPFRNERLPRLVVGLAWLFLGGLTVYHGLTIRRLMQQDNASLKAQVLTLERRIARVHERQQRLDRFVAGADLVEWRFLQDLVNRRTFSWTRLLERLEKIVPAGVRITSLSHGKKDGRMQLSLEAVNRTTRDGLEFVRRLETHPEFDEVYPLGSTRRENSREAEYEMFYEPRVPAGTEAAASPSVGVVMAARADGEP